VQRKTDLALKFPNAVHSSDLAASASSRLSRPSSVATIDTIHPRRRDVGRLFMPLKSHFAPLKRKIGAGVESCPSLFCAPNTRQRRQRSFVKEQATGRIRPAAPLVPTKAGIDPQPRGAGLSTRLEGQPRAAVSLMAGSSNARCLALRNCSALGANDGSVAFNRRATASASRENPRCA
jgi:hypothetical protein